MGNEHVHKIQAVENTYCTDTNWNSTKTPTAQLQTETQHLLHRYNWNSTKTPTAQIQTEIQHLLHRYKLKHNENTYCTDTNWNSTKTSTAQIQTETQHLLHRYNWNSTKTPTAHIQTETKINKQSLLCMSAKSTAII